MRNDHVYIVTTYILAETFKICWEWTKGFDADRILILNCPSLDLNVVIAVVSYGNFVVLTVTVVVHLIVFVMIALSLKIVFRELEVIQTNSKKNDQEYNKNSNMVVIFV